MGSPSTTAYPAETPKEEMVETTPEATLETVPETTRLPKTVGEVIKEDHNVYKALDALSVSLRHNSDFYGALLHEFAISMSNSQNTIGQFEGPLTVAKYAAKDFLDRLIKVGTIIQTGKDV